MNDKEAFKRRIQRLSKEVASKYGFNLYRRTFLVHEECNIAGMIVFDFPPRAMQFHVAAQPLYVPSDMLHITFGYRFERSNRVALGYWGEKEENIENDVAEINEIIECEAIPFLQQVSSPRKMIDFLMGEVPNCIKFPPHYRDMYIAYSCLMVKDYSSAVLPFTNALLKLKEYDLDSTKKQVETIELILNLLMRKDYDAIDCLLISIISNTKTDCGL